MTAQNMLTAVGGFPRAAAADYFAASATPADLRDPTAGGNGIMVAALIHTPSFLMQPAGGEGFFMGCRNNAGNLGYSLSFEDSSQAVVWRAGNQQQIGPLPVQAGHDHALLVGCTADSGVAIGMFLVMNGLLAGGAGPVVWAPEPVLPFSVGNTAEAPAAYGLLDGGVIAVATGPYIWPASGPGSSDFYPAMAQLWAETERAGDILDTQNLFDHVWSCRRGLPNVVDGGNEAWVDWKAGTVMTRQGVPRAGLSVNARTSNWMKAQSAP
jgi:hypothetical protein